MVKSRPSRALPADPDAITRPEAANLLGIAETAVHRLRRDGLLLEVRGGRKLYSRTEVEALAANPWVNGTQAGRILGVSRSRVAQLANAERIPFHVTPAGVRIYRQKQIEVVANARRARAPRRLT